MEDFESQIDKNNKCLICESEEIENEPSNHYTEEIQLFEQLIGQKTDYKLKRSDVVFCKKCKTDLDNYKKLKVSCVRAWKRQRESTNLVPVLVTPELKLFRIEEPQPISYKTANISSSSKISHISSIQAESKTSPITQKTIRDPLYIKPEKKSIVKFTPYRKIPGIERKSTADFEDFYCYICKSIKPQLNKHLVFAHCLHGRNKEMTCTVCKASFKVEIAFLKHFEKYHSTETNYRNKQKTTHLDIQNKASSPQIKTNIKLEKLK